MRLPTAFSPIEPGEIDNFALDFTADVGDSSIASTAWTCALAANQDPSLDPSPQSHILSTSVTTTIVVRDPITNAPVTLIGNYSIASVGDMTDQNVGALYVLEATVDLADGRILKLSSTVRCAPSSAS